MASSIDVDKIRRSSEERDNLSRDPEPLPDSDYRTGFVMFMFMFIR